LLAFEEGKAAEMTDEGGKEDDVAESKGCARNGDEIGIKASEGEKSVSLCIAPMTLT